LRQTGGDKNQWQQAARSTCHDLHYDVPPQMFVEIELRLR
jgi:hypothetical protein